MRNRLAWFAVLSIAAACAEQNNPDPGEGMGDDGGSSSGGSSGKTAGGSSSQGGKASGGSLSNTAGTSSGGKTANGGKGGALNEIGGESSGGEPSSGGTGGSGGSGGSGGKGGSGGSGGSGGKGGSGGTGGGSGSGGSGGTSNCTPSTSGPIGGLSARYQAEIMGSGASIGSQIQLNNTGPSTLNLADLKVRYYFTNEVTANLTTGINWAWYRQGEVDKKPKMMANLVKMSCKAATADSYLEFTFTADAGLLEPAHYVLFSWTSNNSNSQNFTQTNDYSFDGAAKIDTDDAKIVILQNSGTRVWGTEP